MAFREGEQPIDGIGFSRLPRSHTQQTKIEKVQRFPGSTAEQKAEKKEQAQQLRMELLLDTGSLTRLLTQKINENPSLSAEELLQEAQQSSLVLHPDVTAQFIKNTHAAKKETLTAIHEIMTVAKELDEEPVEYLLKETCAGLYAEWEPSGEIRLDTSYPLAIIVEVESEEDFKSIETRKNVVGFFKSRGKAKSSNYWRPDKQLERLRDSDELYIKFPLIVIHGITNVNQGEETAQDLFRPKLTTQNVLLHEKGHAENILAIRTSEQQDQRTFWGRFENFQETYQVASELRGAGKPLEELQESRAWKMVMDYALSHAKDEILAELKGDIWIGHHINTLLEKDNSYDYFNQHLDITQGGSLYTQLWQEYQAYIEEARSAIELAIQVYDIYGLDERKDIFRWVLAQMPIEQWSTQLERTRFTEEARRLYEIYYGIAEFHLDEEHLTDELRNPKKIKAFNKLEADCQANQAKPLFEQIRPFESVWG